LAAPWQEEFRGFGRCFWGAAGEAGARATSAILGPERSYGGAGRRGAVLRSGGESVDTSGQWH